MPIPLPSHSVRRAKNLALKVRAGLNPRGECVSEEIPVPVFWAALSIYEGLFARFVDGKRVCDLGSGPGYGAAALFDAGADEVVAVDIDRRNVRYADRCYSRSRPGLSFVAADIEALPTDDARFAAGSFDVIASSNAFEHLNDLDGALDGVQRLLVPGGTFVLAVPPIHNTAQAQMHAGIRYHRSNLTTSEWSELLGSRFGSIKRWAHHCSEPIDFTDPRPVGPIRDAFSFESVDDENAESITAIFECS